MGFRLHVAFECFLIVELMFTITLERASKVRALSSSILILNNKKMQISTNNIEYKSQCDYQH